MGNKGKYRKVKSQHEQLFAIFNSTSERNAKINRNILQTVMEKLQTELIQLESEIQKEANELEKLQDQQIVVEDEDHFKKLPDEIVEKILGKLKDSKNLSSCCRTCKTFERILEPTKAEWIFPQLLPLLLQTGELELWGVREVCSEWEKAVEEFHGGAVCGLMELESVTESYKCTAMNPNVLKEFSFCYPTFENTAELQQFKRKVETSKDPSKFHLIPSKSLGLQPEFEEDSQSFWGTAEEVVKLLGAHLWRCDIHMNNLDLIETFRLLRNILGHLGSVKMLGLKGSRGGNLNRQLEEDLIKNPFAPLPHLISLQVNDMPDRFYKFVFSQLSKQIRKLEIQDYMGFVFGPNPVNRELPALEILICDPLHPIDTLEWLIQLNCPVLKKLEFAFIYDEKEK